MIGFADQLYILRSVISIANNFNDRLSLSIIFFKSNKLVCEGHKKTA